MSHFVVLVIHDQPPTRELLEATLQPFHEFECTGDDDQYVQDLDITEEVIASFNTDTTHRLRAPDGSLHDPYEDRFYRDPTPEEQAQGLFGTGWGNGYFHTSKDWGDGRGYRPKVKFIPEGYEEIELPTSQVESLLDYTEGYYGKEPVPFGQQPDLEGKHKYGYVLLNEDGTVAQVIKRTNPNKKWDWWQVGGRWSDWLKDVNDEPFLTGPKAVVAFATLRQEAEQDASANWHKVHGAVGELLQTFEPWPVIRERFPDEIGKAREVYHAQPALQVASSHPDLKPLFDWTASLDDYLVDHDAYVRQQGLSRTTPFAILHNSNWTQRGDMGWWGVVSDEQVDWTEKAHAYIEALPDTAWLTVIDCHM